jgi:lysophospholipase L1-like esterase
MRFSKSWLYAGLVAVAGLGVLRVMTGPRVKRGMRVLLIGDSLAVGMAPHFQALAKEAGVNFQSLAIVGTRIDQWASSAQLQKTLDQFQPELVMISLGTNDEYLTGDAVTRQRPALETLINKISQYTRNADYGLGPEWIVWIGPPTLPKPTNGIVAMIQAAAGTPLAPRFYYYHSEQLELPRGPDKLHPTARGYAGWAGAVWHWLS